MSASLLSRAAPALEAASLADFSPERGCAFAALGAELALLAEHVPDRRASRAAAGRSPSRLVSSAP